MLVKGIPGLNELVINYFIRLCDQREIPFIPYDESYWILQQLWFDDSGALPTGEKQPARQANNRRSRNHHYNDITWALWRCKSRATRMFIQQLFRSQLRKDQSNAPMAFCERKTPAHWFVPVTDVRKWQRATASCETLQYSLPHSDELIEPLTCGDRFISFN